MSGTPRLKRDGSEESGCTSPRFVDGPSGRAAASQTAQTPKTGLRALRLHEAVSFQAEHRDDACAIVFESVEVSYGALERRADQLASQLIARGVRRGEVVGLYMHRSPEMVAAMLAILKAGAAYLPLDPDFPQARLEMILADANTAAVLTEGSLAGALDFGETLCLRCEDVARDHAVDFVRPAVGADDLAYVLYTSGSTGRPKGVEISHGAVMNLLASFVARPAFTERDIMLAATTTAFDISVLELFLPLVAGGRIVLASAAVSKDPRALAALIDGSDCTFVQTTPSKWRYLLDAGWNGRPGLTLICGGEALTRDLADRLAACGEALWNVYGPTETTVWSTLGKVKPGSGAVPIGWPVEETTLHVLDADGIEVPAGAVGELYIGGSGLARGYRAQPELTRQRFGVRNGERLYRTGDLVRRGADGALECLGRTDHQVKVRGFRIELGDVEAALAQCAGLTWGAARSWTDGEGETQLVAYVVFGKDVSRDPAALRRALSDRLPAYMIPSRLVGMDALPMTPNGKIDRNALPAPHPSICLESAVSHPLIGATQIRLGTIWCEVLGLASVSADDNFFDLGGYSLLTLTLLQRIEAGFDQVLSMADLFGFADLAAMAARLDAEDAPVASRVIPLQPLGHRPSLIWFDVGPQLRDLASALAPDQPFIGLNLEPAEERELLAISRLQPAKVAERLVAVLRTVQPHGPYYLGGWCRWGVMAFAAASQLLEDGEEVALLVLLDAANMQSRNQVLRRAKQVARRSLGLPTGPGDAWADPANFGAKVERAANRYRAAALQRRCAAPARRGCGTGLGQRLGLARRRQGRVEGRRPGRKSHRNAEATPRRAARPNIEVRAGARPAHSEKQVMCGPERYSAASLRCYVPCVPDAF